MKYAENFPIFDAIFVQFDETHKIGHIAQNSQGIFVHNAMSNKWDSMILTYSDRRCIFNRRKGWRKTTVYVHGRVGLVVP